MKYTEQQTRVLEEVDMWVGKIESIFNLKIEPSIRFSNKMTRCGGTVRLYLQRVVFSNAYLHHEGNGQTFYERTVPHELAHIVAYILYGSAKGSGHGPLFYGVMRRMGVKEEHISRCHSMTHAGRIKIECPGCGKQITFSDRRLKKAVTGKTTYACAQCDATYTRAYLESFVRDKEAMAAEIPQKTLQAKTKTLSPYGTAVNILCKNPDMTKEQLVAKCKKAGIDVDKGKNGISTAYSTVRSIVGRLRNNELMK